MIARLLCMVLILLAGAVPAWAEDDFVTQVRHEFAGELFPMDKLAPGYERPDTPVPSLAIGDFLTDDETLQNWHFAIGDLLRRRIQYVPTVRLTMPSAYYTALDAGVDRDFYDPVLATPAHFKGLRRAMGIENILTGTVTRDGDALQIEAQLVDSRKGEELANSSWQVTDETLPAVLIAISSWVYDELGVELTESQRAYLEDASTLTPEAVQAYLENYIDLNMSELVVRQELLAELREAHPTLAMFQLYELHAKSFPTNLREARENLEISNRSREAFPGHAGVALESYRTLEVSALEDYELERRLNGLRDLVVANPNDPMIMINYANAWGEQGDIHEGISVALEIVERWPDNYRGWWTLGWLVSRHAWQVRGETLWAEVPEPNRKTFRLMSFLSDQIIDKALRMNNKNGGLWVMKLSGIGSNGGYSSKLMTTFDTAAEVAPTHEPIYATALNFSQNKWGGNAAARRHIIETAEANNPNAAWPSFMRSVHQADFEGLEGLADALKDEAQVRGILENPLFWKVLFGLIVLIVIVASNLSMRRARRAMGSGPDGTDNYNRGWNEKPITGRELTQEEMLERVRRQNQSPHRH